LALGLDVCDELLAQPEAAGLDDTAAIAKRKVRPAEPID